jgi:hypothetical protein
VSGVAVERKPPVVEALAVSAPEDSHVSAKQNGGDMIYKIKARVIDETIGGFYSKLADGTVARQRPDGEEIVAAMKRAVLTGPGVAGGLSL